MRSANRIRCASCGRRIREPQPDLILESVAGGSAPRYYHDRCGGAAYALAMERPIVYLLTVHHAGPSRN